MCGIVGYIGKKNAPAVLVDGLNRLSYRGYDSAGIAVMEKNGCIGVRKTKGKLENLERLLQEQPVSGFSGIGHTRWATHGAPTDRNAHPHTDVLGGIAVVHNGIIENHRILRKRLEKEGVQFASETDSEVIGHLLHRLYDGDMLSALTTVQGMLEGSYAIGILCSDEPEKLYCMRNDSPLVIGAAEGEAFLASDVPALLAHTRDVIFLEDGEIGVLTCAGITVYNHEGSVAPQQFHRIDWDAKSAEKSGYDHFMLKEIHEQPEALAHTLAARDDWQNLNWFPLERHFAQKISRITLCACGTAYHAAVMGKYYIENLAGIPVEAAIASEYRYRKPFQTQNEWLIAISQSGETADTLAALREAKRQGIAVSAVCNAVGSSIAREAGENHTLYTYAGPEIAVASTKAYITQVEMLLLIAMALAEIRKTCSTEQINELGDSLENLPCFARSTLLLQDHIQQIAKRMREQKHVFFVGRGLDYALAMEAALKLKEISYVFAEAYAAGELKHGPIALLENGRLVFALLTQPALLEKSLNNLQEIKARGATIVAVCQKHMAVRVCAVADEVIAIPDADEKLAPLIAAIPLQLFAYFMAVQRGCDVDQPRNLAKSVTVE